MATAEDLGKGLHEFRIGDRVRSIHVVRSLHGSCPDRMDIGPYQIIHVHPWHPLFARAQWCAKSQVHGFSQLHQRTTFR